MFVIENEVIALIMKQLIFLLPFCLVIGACNTSNPEPISQASPPVSVEAEVINNTTTPTPLLTPMIPTATAQMNTPTPRPTIQAADTTTAAPVQIEKLQLKQVSAWSFAPDGESALQLVESGVDLVVLNFDPQAEAIADAVAQLQQAGKPRLVLAYLNVGQADPAQSYWQPDWEAGNPWWLIESKQQYANNNVPVAYWNDDYRHIWLADDGYLQAALEAGFDGIYVDGIEAYADEAVIDFSKNDGSDPQQEMIWLLGDMIDFVKSRQPDFMVITHNAAGLMTQPEAAYVLEGLDGLAQELNWLEPPILDGLAAAGGRCGNVLIQIAREHVGALAVRGEETGHEIVGDGTGFRRATGNGFGIGARLQMCGEDMHGQRKPGHDDLRFKQVPREVVQIGIRIGVSERLQVDAVEPLR